MSPGRGGDPTGGQPWYASWFGDDYLGLYPHRDEEEAGRGVALLLEATSLLPGDPVLDLACGAGRHTRPLAARGLRVFGLDLSEVLLLRAKEVDSRSLLLRADMRLIPFGANRFAAVTSFFTSFGYFRSEDDDLRVLLEIRRVLKEGGHFLLDFLNAERTRATLRPRDEAVIEGRRVIQERRIVDAGRRVEKTIRIAGKGGEAERTYRERVRLYSAGELAELLARAGLAPGRWFGDYSGAPVGESAPRVIALASAS